MLAAVFGRIEGYEEGRVVIRDVSFSQIPAPQIVKIAIPDSTNPRNVSRPSSSRNIFWRALPREITRYTIEGAGEFEAERAGNGPYCANQISYYKM